MENKYEFSGVKVIGDSIYGNVTVRKFRVAGGKVPKGFAIKVPQGRVVEFNGVDLEQVLIYAMNHWLVQTGKLRTKEIAEIKTLLNRPKFDWSFAEKPTTEKTESDKQLEVIRAMVGSMSKNKIAKKAIVDVVNATFSREFKNFPELEEFVKVVEDEEMVDLTGTDDECQIVNIKKDDEEDKE